jgi:transcriptional regulator with XRE-family HTH domain
MVFTMALLRVNRTDHPAAASVATRQGRALLLRARELRGELSLAAAAKRIGIRPDELGKIERGETRQVRWETLLGMAEAYQVEVGDLLVTAQAASETEPAYAGILAAMRSGSMARVIPPRFVGDPDAARAERGDLDHDRAVTIADFAESVPTAEVRRSAFRPTGR